MLLDLETSAYFSLNETSALIWELLDAGATVPAAASGLCRAYGIKPESAERDVKALVQKLIKAGVLIPSTQDSAAASSDLEKVVPSAKEKRSYIAPALAAFGLLSTLPNAAFGSGDL